MHHSKIEPHADIHAAWCGCRDCASRDAMGYAKKRRIVRAQAAALIVFALILYGTIAANVGSIAASVGGNL